MATCNVCGKNLFISPRVPPPPCDGENHEEITKFRDKNKKITEEKENRNRKIAYNKINDHLKDVLKERFGILPIKRKVRFDYRKKRNERKVD